MPGPLPLSSVLRSPYASVLSYASLSSAPPARPSGPPPATIPLIDGRYFPHIVETVVELAP